MPAPRHPYDDIPASAHWMRAVAGRAPLAIADWATPKFVLGDRRVASAGSCFAQHLGPRLRQAGLHFVDCEPAPPFLSDRRSRRDFGYDLYSARHGNVYTSRQWLQLFRRAFGQQVPVADAWERDGGIVDPFRPTIEPEPFGSVEEMRRSRRHHLECVRQVFETAEVFVFTLGLTECWADAADGMVFPVAPGVAGGRWDERSTRFVNLDVAAVLADLRALFAAARAVSPRMQFILTVSPVPLMATATRQHVVAATMLSKSTLRAATAALADEDDGVDYFPSYEMVAAPCMRAEFFDDDLRTVRPAGVDHVMQQFLAAHGAIATSAPGPAHPARASGAPVASADTSCDEELLRVSGATT